MLLLPLNAGCSLDPCEPRALDYFIIQERGIRMLQKCVSKCHRGYHLWGVLTGGNSPARSEHSNQAFDRRPNSHSTTSQTKKNINQRRYAHHPALSESTNPSLDTTIQTSSDPRVRIETLARQRSRFLNSPTQIQHARERVGEVDHEKGAHETDDAAQVGNRSGDQEG